MPAIDISTAYSEGRLIRRRWSGTDSGGRQLLCLYTALAGDPDARPGNCPADLAPAWVANFLPWLDEAPSEEAWPGIVERVIAIADRLPLLTPECEWRVRAAFVRDAMRHTEDAYALEMYERAAVLYERRGVDADSVPAEEMWAAEEAAVQAEWAAAARSAASDVTVETVRTKDLLCSTILTIMEEDLK